MVCSRDASDALHLRNLEPSWQEFGLYRASAPKNSEFIRRPTKAGAGVLNVSWASHFSATWHCAEESPVAPVSHAKFGLLGLILEQMPLGVCDGCSGVRCGKCLRPVCNATG